MVRLLESILAASALADRNCSLTYRSGDFTRADGRAVLNVIRKSRRDYRSLRRGEATRSVKGLELVGARGFEPPTPRSRTECSTRLSHAPIPGAGGAARDAAPTPILS